MIKGLILLLALSGNVYARRQIEVKNPRGEQLRMQLHDGIVPVGITPSGNLQVSSEPRDIPSGTERIRRIAVSDVSGSSDTACVIPAGSTVTIQNFSVGSEGNLNGAEVELFIDELGDGTNLIIIENLFVNGTSSQTELAEDVVGDGVRSILVRRTNNSGGSTKIFARWNGYLTP